MQIKKYNYIDLGSLIYPLFIQENQKAPSEIISMPGVYRHTMASLHDELLYLQYLGIKKVLLFGIPDVKTDQGQSAYCAHNFLTKTIEYIKAQFPEITVFTDICLCAYTLHGHCGIIDKDSSHIEGQATLSALSEMALNHARAGADYVAPSAMAKGQVKAIRSKLNSFGYDDVKIMAYSAKFSSNFYGPFREIADSAPKFGDRSAYQLNYKSKVNAILKIDQDIKDGADIVMVKPALSYLDIAKHVKDKFNYPLALYNVSGEYAMAKLGAEKGLWIERDFVDEILTSMQRAGADYIITYHALDVARWQKKSQKRKFDYAECTAI
jgi:porphobilinogen synthase